MTKQEAAARIERMLSDWRTVGEIARAIGIPRSSVEREVRRMESSGMVEAETRSFWRNGGRRMGRAYRMAAPITCAPVGGVR